MIDVASQETMQSRQMMQGWGVSALLHLGLVFAAVTVMPKVTLVVEEAPFKWDVALVEQVHNASSPEVPPPTPKSQPSTPLRTQSPRPAEPPPETVMPRVAPQQSTQVVHPVLEPPKPERPVPTEVQPVVKPVEPPPPIPQVAQIQPKPVEREKSKKDEVKEPEPPVKQVVPAEVVKEVSREVTPTVEPVAQVHAALAPTPAASPSVAEQPAEPAPVSPSPSPAVAEQQTEQVATAGAPPIAATEPVAATEPATASPSPPPTVAAPSTSPAESVAASSASVVASVPASRPAVKADYAWLAESLGRRIAALTRYPSSARLNGWEGRVVLRAVIRSDGHLSEVTVHRSSGHDALDRAAVETIKLACPLHMKHALNTTEVAVYVPIVYSLSG